MDHNRSIAMEVAGVAITLLFVWVGLAMAHDPPAAADAAVGKGLLALAGATAILTFCLLTDRVEREADAKEATPSRPATYRDADGV
jgi:hypothetical protein